MNLPRYRAIDGRVCVREDGAWREVGTALTANGRDVERYEAARLAAARQREEGK